MTQVWLVTGSSRGLGRAIVEAGLAAGNSVLATARDIESLSELPERYGDQVKLFALDVTDEAAAAAAVKTAIDAFGSLDVVINNAGALDLRSTQKLPPKNFRRLLEINVEGPFAVVQAALPHLRQSDNAHIVNVSPPLTMEPSWVGAHVGHTVGKYAESLLTLGWATEFASIPVACRCPLARGQIQTSFQAGGMTNALIRLSSGASLIGLPCAS